MVFSKDFFNRTLFSALLVIVRFSPSLKSSFKYPPNSTATLSPGKNYLIYFWTIYFCNCFHLIIRHGAQYDFFSVTRWRCGNEMDVTTSYLVSLSSFMQGVLTKFEITPKFPKSKNLFVNINCFGTYNEKIKE